MYSPDMKLQQEEYDNLFLPFNYEQVECNHIYIGQDPLGLHKFDYLWSGVRHFFEEAKVV